MEVFYKVVRRETERCIPKKMRRKSSRPLWMSKNIIRLIRKKRRLWQNYTSSEYYRQDYGSFQAYKEVEKRVKAEVKKAKRKFERKLAKQAKKNSKQFYSCLKKSNSNRVRLMGEGEVMGIWRKANFFPVLKKGTKWAQPTTGLLASHVWWGR